ncbi:MAG: LacI family DNA-binding transcriptional regulator [Actinomyces urogenitalis]|uniref:LacI family DNA-binding transcriptional regulator n=1 Tax=Actinomyces urogenitalis TaxID=103621 RepID=UPI00242FA762|nr:LacI family DNA-binding transcriptional regulator [Actinomyces urogenitalis]MCI7457338.1 LacI family transcriptional regulator [Actinomyces urogenitalis]MDY3679363.1 LacI family DNA-binding transcriptional regulator [Actinomyces urogenitalis]
MTEHQIAPSSRQRRTTLTDVGRAVGVSAKTVSNVVNGSGWVSDEVRAKVLQAIEDLGYRPNLAARQLRTGSSGLVSLALPDLKEPYFAEMAAAIVDEAERRGRRALISQTRGDRNREIDAIEGLGLPDLDGIIISPLDLQAPDIRERRSTTPLVTVGEFGGELYGAGASHVGIDNVAAARAATQHLIDQGCRSIAVVGYQEDQTRQTSVQRYAGYRQALSAAGIHFDERLVGTVEVFTRADGAHAVDQILTRGGRFDSLFCFSDSLAFGAVYALSTHGLSVPTDVRLIGFDNTEEGRFSVPPFDTVDPSITTLATQCLQVIEARTTAQMIIPATIVSRVPQPVGTTSG